MIPKPLKASLGSEPGGVFYLHGDDEFRKQEAATALVEAHLDPSTRDFNFDRLRGSELDPEALASILGTPPMMAEWRVVHLTEAQALAGSPRLRDLLLKTVESPPSGLALILSCTVPSGSKARFYRDLASGARSMEFQEVGVHDLPGWILERSEEAHGRTFEEEAARALAHAVGTDLALLDRELQKLASMVEEGASVSLAEVEAAGIRIPRQDRWEWFDLVGERKIGEAVRGLRILLDHGESGVGLTIGLATHLLRLGVAVTGGTGALEGALPPRQRWLARRFGGQARRWTAAEVDEALGELLKVDQLLKAGGASDLHLLESWLFELATRQEAA
jgi:DNA polymerase III subunit delta